mmetsp:Transcript_12145/g.44306  ORF Transcript_12145/g.44306 Transcript_12145/m.44306 type:complete len:719 (-) Transcript_12145:53-2209(-)
MTAPPASKHQVPRTEPILAASEPQSKLQREATLRHLVHNAPEPPTTKTDDAHAPDSADPGQIAALKVFTKQALVAKKSEGSSPHYDTLVKEVKGAIESKDSQRLALILTSLEQNVMSMHPQAHGSLLATLFSIDVWEHRSNVLEAAIALQLNLVSANSVFIKPVLDMLVTSFYPKSYAQPSLGEASMLVEATGETQVSIHGKVVGALHHLVQVVPTVMNGLVKAILEKFPHRRLSSECQVMYVQGMFRLAETGCTSTLSEKLLSIVIDHFVAIDVEIRWEDMVRANQQANEDEGDLVQFDFDVEDRTASTGGQSGGSDSGFMGAGGRDTDVRSNLRLPQMADKLDKLMDILFEHIHRRSVNGQLRPCFDAVIRSFEATVLFTHRSKFVQFIVLYICSLKPGTHCPAFCKLLLEYVMGPAMPIVKRQAAAAYLTSFLARATYVPLTECASVLSTLCGYAHSYADGHRRDRNAGRAPVETRFVVPGPVPSEGGASDVVWHMERHGVFYVICQAIMYTMCYKMDALLADRGASRIIRSLPFQTWIDSELAPLSVCLPSITAEFSAQTQRHGLCSCPARVADQPDGRYRLRGLDMFFPFDPYLLRTSSRWIKEIWQAWHSSGEADSEEEDENDAEVESDDMHDTDESDNDEGGSEISERMESHRISGVSGAGFEPKSYGSSMGGTFSDPMSLTPPAFTPPVSTQPTTSESRGLPARPGVFPH